MKLFEQLFNKLNKIKFCYFMHTSFKIKVFLLPAITPWILNTVSYAIYQKIYEHFVYSIMMM